MNILVVSQYFYPEQFRINEICTELTNRGHKVTVLTGQPNYPEGNIYEGYQRIKEEEFYNETRIIRCKLRPRKTGNLNLGLNYLSFMMNASRKINKLTDKFDVVLVYQLSPILMAVPAIKYKKRHKVPLVFYTLDIWPESIRDVFGNDQSAFFKIVKSISRRIYQQADMIAVTSRPFEDYLESVCEVDRDRICYIPQHAEDLSRDSELSTVDNGVVDFVFLGNVGHAQNLICVLKAAKGIETEVPYAVHIVGDGSELNNLKEFVNHNNIDGIVTFHGRHPLSEMPTYYRIADVCVLSLIDEGIIGMTVPGKLQGYMSAGKAVVASANGPSKEMIDDARCGVCVPSNDEEQLKEAMKYLCENRDSLNQYGKNAREYYLENFTVDIFVNRLLDCFKKTTDLSKG